MTNKNKQKSTAKYQQPLDHKLKSLSDTELLAIFLQSNNKKSAITKAYNLLTHFGTIQRLLDSDVISLHKKYRISICQIQILKAALELSRRYLKCKIIKTNIISNSEAAHQYLATNLRHHQREVFACIFLDNNNQALAYEELFYGSINTITVHPREVVKIALQLNASAVIFAHNHPSGNSKASQKDIALTKSLSKILDKLDIKVLDHIIIGDDNYLSMMDRILKAN